MSGRRMSFIAVATVVVGIAVMTTVAFAGGASTTPTTPTVTDPSSAQIATTTTPTHKASKDDRATAKELRALADAWHEGGGHFGYPFWEKAFQRWKSKAITASVFREYVTGYRDNLQLGCELIDTVDVNHDASRDVRDLVIDACKRRVEALRAQKLELDALVKRDAASVDAPLDAEARAKLAGEIAEQHSIVDDKLQQSWRDTRLAMDRAQAQLDAYGLDRLDEDAII